MRNSSAAGAAPRMAGQTDTPALKPIRTYAVTVEGFPAHLYSARSPGKARAQSYRAYSSFNDSVSFGGFMRISTVRCAPSPPGIGERILVGGLPATRVIGHSQYVHFMRDDSDTILCSHPADVEALP